MVGYKVGCYNGVRDELYLRGIGLRVPGEILEKLCWKEAEVEMGKVYMGRSKGERGWMRGVEETKRRVWVRVEKGGGSE